MDGDRRLSLVLCSNHGIFASSRGQPWYTGVALVLVPVNYVDACTFTVYSGATYTGATDFEVSWDGGSTWLPYSGAGSKAVSRIPDSGNIQIRSIIDITAIVVTSDTYTSANIVNDGLTLTSCQSMFDGGAGFITNLTSVTANSLTGITSTRRMFNNCSSLLYVPAVMDTSAVTNMQSMFAGCYLLTSVPAVLDTSSATNMQGVFDNCRVITSVPNVLDTSLATITSYMFRNTYALTQVPSTLDMSSNLDARYMFNGSGVTSISAPLATSLVTNFTSMFQSASSLTCLTSIDTTAVGAVTTDMFLGASSLANPTSGEQTTILSGSSYTNSGSCP